MFSDAAEKLFGAADVDVDGFITYAEIMSEFAKIDTDSKEHTLLSDQIEQSAVLAVSSRARSPYLERVF